MPPNILYIKETYRKRKTNSIRCEVVQIPHTGSQYKTLIDENEIVQLRKDLEKVWSDKTRYHGTAVNANDEISKGQCGVSSLHLARHLESIGHNVLFCEGDVYFPECNPILKHCWIKLYDPKEKKDNLIIDITADQSGYKQEVICMDEEELRMKGILYKAVSEVDVENVGVDHLLRRLEYLEKELHINGKRRSQNAKQ